MAETITARMAQWAAGVKFEHIGDKAVHEARRYLLDSLGCAFGGYRQEDAEIALHVLDEIGGKGASTIIGTGKKADPVTAALANALMVRIMDYNDIYWQQDPSHPSDIIPAAMACGVPDPVCHIIAAHADEGNLVKRTTEALIVHHADFMSFLPFKNL